MIKAIRYSANYGEKQVSYCAVYDDKKLSLDEAKRIIMNGEVENHPLLVQMTETQYENIILPLLKNHEKVYGVIYAQREKLKESSEELSELMNDYGVYVVCKEDFILEIL